MTNKAWLLVGIIVILLIVGAIFMYRQSPVGGGDGGGSNLTQPAQRTALEGEVVSVSPDGWSLSVKRTDGNTREVRIERGATIKSEYQGLGDTEAKVVPGAQIRTAVASDGGANEITITHFPELAIYNIKSGDSVGTPFFISGVGRAFENQFLWRIKNADGSVLARGMAYANASDQGLFGPFNIKASYPSPKSAEGYAEVYNASMKDGSEINVFSVPVKFAAATTIPVKVYFGDSASSNCSTVHPIQLYIEKTTSVAKRALEEVISGYSSGAVLALDADTGQDFGPVASVPTSTKILSLTISNGTARADFSEDLQKNVGGSCRVAMIHAQLVKTLTQFPTVKNAEICIEGECRPEYILQP